MSAETPLVRNWARYEQEARDASVEARPRLTPVPELADQAKPVSAPGGQPLPAGAQNFYQTQFGHDFSQVRVHADAPAVELTEEAQARALTRGRDIFFGPGEFQPDRPEGRELLTHELAHVAQQQQGAPGAGVTQAQNKPTKQGPGSVAPDELYSVAKGVAAEDTFVLFDLNNAYVTGAAEKQLGAGLGHYATPVVVEVDGYASTEGDTDYNLNLSAWRALAVKKLLLDKLPPGSEVRVVARGETSAFGPAESNRRVGVHVIPGAVPTPQAPKKEAPASDQPVEKKEEGWSLDPRKRKTLTLDPTLLPSTLPTLPTQKTGALPPNFFVLPPLTTPSLLDWNELRTPFTSHGLLLGDRDIRAIEQNWGRTYEFLRSIGLSPDLAAWGANKGTAYAYDDYLSRENPNAFDLAEQQSDKLKAIMLPGVTERKTPIVPIITPTTLNWIGKTFFHKDIKFEF